MRDFVDGVKRDVYRNEQEDSEMEGLNESLVLRETDEERGVGFSDLHASHAFLSN